MNFYLDFEATQYTQEILSIGCVADNGNTFYQLVRPHETKSITKFITKLTGLSAELLAEEGVLPDEAFERFQSFLIQNQKGTAHYYCYGNNDRIFLRDTAKYLRNNLNKNFVEDLKKSLIDYSTVVKKEINENLSLLNIIKLLRHDQTIRQRHNALEDALWLKECADTLPEREIKKNEIQELLTPHQKSEPISEKIAFRAEGKKHTCLVTAEVRTYLAKMRRIWTEIRAEDIQGDASPDQARIKLISNYSDQIWYFSSPVVAATFFNMKIASKRSAKNLAHLQATLDSLFNRDNGYYSIKGELIGGK